MTWAVLNSGWVLKAGVMAEYRVGKILAVGWAASVCAPTDASTKSSADRVVTKRQKITDHSETLHDCLNDMHPPVRKNDIRPVSGLERLS